MEIYSFYRIEKGEKIVERLKDHILLALEAIEDESRLLRFGRSLNKNFLDVLKYSIIFHDFGKIFHNKYDFKENKSLSFDGHEIISCWGANEYLKKKQEEIGSIERKIIVLSILLHHHPMNIKEKIERLKKRYEKVDGTFFSLFYEELGQIIERKEISVSKSASEISGEVQGLLKELWTNIWMNSNSNIRKTLLLNIQALIAADYYSASKKRGDKTDFKDVVDTFIKFYMTPNTRATP